MHCCRGAGFSHLEIYKADKGRGHLPALHRKTGVAYEDMVFFDNERYNITDVSPLGVHCAHCPRGMDVPCLDRALAAFAGSRR